MASSAASTKKRLGTLPSCCSSSSSSRTKDGSQRSTSSTRTTSTRPAVAILAAQQGVEILEAGEHGRDLRERRRAPREAALGVARLRRAPGRARSSGVRGQEHLHDGPLDAAGEGHEHTRDEGGARLDRRDCQTGAAYSQNTRRSARDAAGGAGADGAPADAVEAAAAPADGPAAGGASVAQLRERDVAQDAQGVNQRLPVRRVVRGAAGAHLAPPPERGGPAQRYQGLRGKPGGWRAGRGLGNTDP